MLSLLQEIYVQLLPVLLQMIAAVVGVLLLRLFSRVQERWGIEIEARHREALQSAIMTGITAAMTRGLRGKDAITAALTYAGKSVPDAISALGPTAEVLEDMARSRLHQANPPRDKIEVAR